MLHTQHFRAPEADELSARLALLQDYIEITRGDPYTYPEIAEYLSARGVSLSRSRWSYMTTGEHWRIRDRSLLDALADLFEVETGFFYTSSEIPQHMAPIMKQVLALRITRMQRLVKRELTDLAPDTCKAITEILERG